MTTRALIAGLVFLVSLPTVALAAPEHLGLLVRDGDGVRCEVLNRCNDDSTCAAGKRCSSLGDPADPSTFAHYCTDSRKPEREVLCCPVGASPAFGCPMRDGMIAECRDLPNGIDVCTYADAASHDRSGFCTSDGSSPSESEVAACLDPAGRDGGDCDSDGVVNGEDCAACDPTIARCAGDAVVPDSGTSSDGGAVPPDAGNHDGGLLTTPDAADVFDASVVRDVRASDPGCSCEAVGATTSPWSTLGAALWLLLRLRRRRGEYTRKDNR